MNKDTFTFAEHFDPNYWTYLNNQIKGLYQDVFNLALKMREHGVELDEFDKKISKYQNL